MTPKNNQDIVTAIDALTRATVAKQTTSSTDANGWTVTLNQYNKKVYTRRTTAAVNLPAGISFQNISIGSTPVDVGSSLANYVCSFTVYLPTGGRQVSMNFMNTGTALELGAINLFTGGTYAATATISLVITEA